MMDKDQGTMTGGATGALVGLFVAGPGGAALGGLAGSMIGRALGGTEDGSQPEAGDNHGED